MRGPTTPMGAATAGPSSRKGTSSAPVIQSWVTNTVPGTHRSSRTTAGATTRIAAVELTRVERTQPEKKSAKPSVARTKRSWALCPRPKLLNTAMPDANSTAAAEIRPTAAPNSAICAAAPAMARLNRNTPNSRGTTLRQARRQSTVNR